MIQKTFPVTSHTDFVGQGSTFVAIKGMSDDGVNYVKTALERGADRIIVEGASITDELKSCIKRFGAELIVVENARKALAYESAKAHNFPARKLKIFAVTGTKGKTTTSFLLAHILKVAGYKTALLSSEANILHDVVLPSTLTTPQPDYLHVFFSECLKQNVTHVVMEVAAQAISCHRVEGITFDGLIFTNFAQEHGEFYASEEKYFAAKCQLIEYLKPNAPLFLNADDEKVSALKDKWSNSFLFGTRAPFCILRSSSDLNGTIVDLQLNKETETFQCSTLLGNYNGYNMACAAAFSHFLDIHTQLIKNAFTTFAGVPGRLNPQKKFQLPSGAYVFIDKAHNPSSFEAVLSTLRIQTNDLIIVFGAGGERDKEKRPVMGALATKYGNMVFITSDNPRSESPLRIIEDIFAGIDSENQLKVIKEVDRKKAIISACLLAQEQSIVVLLGKGAERYQEVEGQKYHFNEEEIISSAVRSILAHDQEHSSQLG